MNKLCPLPLDQVQLPCACEEKHSTLHAGLDDSTDLSTARVKHGKTNATLPKDLDMDDVTLEQAVELIAAKLAKGGAKKAKPKVKSKPKKIRAAKSN